MRLYTIGFTKKSAEEFFRLLEANNVKKIIDARLNNSSQLAGFTKGTDLKYFLQRIDAIDYIHSTELAPTKSILDNYKKKVINWAEYEAQFMKLLDNRKPPLTRDMNLMADACILCSEEKPDQCHRRLVAEYIKKTNPDENIEIHHII